MSSTDSGFIREIVVNDILEKGKCSEMLLAALQASHFQRTPSEFIFRLDYTQIPVNIEVIPVAELNRGEEHWEPAWDPLIEKALQSSGELMMVNARVQRGGLRALRTYLMNPPLEI